MDRLTDWQTFSEQMERHIVVYAEKQYENTDVNIRTSLECITAIKKYTDRHGKGVRGNKEAMRDMYKIAHYAQFAYNLLKKELCDDGGIYENAQNKRL